MILAQVARLSGLKNLLIACLSIALGACGSVKYTVDDGRPVDEELLNNIRLLGHGERLLRPAIQRAAALKDPDCSKQWDLPFSVASSYDLEPDARVAWVRALQVDERISVISALPESGLEVGDKLVALDGYQKNDSKKMIERLADLRDGGDPFPVTTARGKSLTVKPFQVCRGYVRLASPAQANLQEYHWLTSIHPLEIFNPQLSPDEALWIVLWTQGLSEEGGARMKTFHYSKSFVLTLLDIASLATGLNAAATAAKAAAAQAMTSASSAAAKAASEEVSRQILEAAAKNIAETAAKEYAKQLGEEIGKITGKQVGSALTLSLADRAGFSLSMLSRVATTTFDYADAWAFQRMLKLGANPIAGATLHRKLVERGNVMNAFALDEERLGTLAIEARKTRHEEMLLAAIRGASLEDYTLQLVDMPESTLAGAVMETASAMPGDAPPPTTNLANDLIPASSEQ